MVDFSMTSFLRGGTRELIRRRNIADQDARELEKKTKEEKRAEDRAKRVQKAKNLEWRARKEVEVGHEKDKETREKDAAAALRKTQREEKIAHRMKQYKSRHPNSKKETQKAFAMSTLKISEWEQNEIKNEDRKRFNERKRHLKKLVDNKIATKLQKQEYRNMNSQSTHAKWLENRSLLERDKAKAAAKTPKAPGVQVQKHMKEMLGSLQIRMERILNLPKDTIKGNALNFRTGELSPSVAMIKDKGIRQQIIDLYNSVISKGSMYSKAHGKDTITSIKVALDEMDNKQQEADNYIATIKATPATEEALDAVLQTKMQHIPSMSITQIQQFDLAVSELVRKIRQAPAPAGTTVPAEPTPPAAKEEGGGMMESIKGAAGRAYDAASPQTRAFVDRVRRVFGSFGANQQSN